MSTSQSLKHWQYIVVLCRTVHNDVYKIIKYSIQKSMSGEVAQRALDWWAGLVEHLFGLPVRTPEQEKAVVPAAEDHSNRQKVCTNLPVIWPCIDITVACDNNVVGIVTPHPGLLSYITEIAAG